MDQEISLKVKIGGRYYPLTIKFADEVKVRRAEELLEERFRKLEAGYAVKDKQDLLAMASLQVVSELLHELVNIEERGGAAETLDELNEELRKFLDQQ